jgi:hypothetical protein
MATKFSSSHSFFNVPASRLHITQRPLDYTTSPQSLTPEQLKDLALHTVAIWIELHDALHAGVKELTEAAQQTALSRAGIGTDGIQDEPLASVWGPVKFKSLEFTLTVHSDTLPQDALSAAIAHLLTIRALREEFGAVEEKSDPAPQAPKSAAPALKVVAKADPRETREAVHFETFDGKEKEQHVNAGLISFDVHQIERQFSPKGDKFWTFYGFFKGRESQYPCAGVRVYEDAKFLPDDVKDLLSAIEGEREGLWRVVASVVEKAGKVYYNVQSISPMSASEVEAQALDDDEGIDYQSEIPF